MHIERVVKQVDFVLKPYHWLRGEAFMTGKSLLKGEMSASAYRGVIL